MHLVRDTTRASAVGRSGVVARAALAAAAAALAVGSLSACGEAESSGAAEAERDSLGPVYLADCTDWNEATEEAGLRTIRQIRQFAGGPVLSSGTGATLTNDEAVRLFETTCANDYARGFKLYKLYTRAASLGGP